MKVLYLRDAPALDRAGYRRDRRIPVLFSLNGEQLLSVAQTMRYLALLSAKIHGPGVLNFPASDIPLSGKALEHGRHRPDSSRGKELALHPSATLQGHIGIGQSQGPSAISAHYSTATRLSRLRRRGTVLWRSTPHLHPALAMALEQR